MGVSVTEAPQAGDGYELLFGSWAQALAGGQNLHDQSIVCHAGGGQASATQIGPNAAVVYLKTVASVADSAKLPAAKKGMLVFILNGTANSANIYGFNATDDINGTLGSTAAACAGNKSILFFCPADGFWGAIGGS
jgi:hypothetical protein